MPTPKRPRDGRDSLLVLIKTVQRAVRTQLEDALSGVGMSLAQQAVLVSLLRSPGASNAELARAAFVSPQSMGEVLTGLERAGLVVRSPDPDHARVLRATVTAAGLKAIGRGGARTASVEARLLGAMSQREQRQLRRLLGRCLAALQDERPKRR